MIGFLFIYLFRIVHGNVNDEFDFRPISLRLTLVIMQFCRVNKKKIIF